MKAFWGLLCFASGAFGQAWVQQITPEYAVVRQIAASPRGECAISGWTSPGTNSPNFGTTNLKMGNFFAQYDANGNFIRAQQTTNLILLANVGNKLIGIGDGEIFQIRRDGTRRHEKTVGGQGGLLFLSPCDDRTFVVAGSFQGSILIGKQIFADPGTNSSVGFVARLDAKGKVIWLTQHSIPFVRDIAGTRSGGAYVLGTSFEIEAFDSRGRHAWSNSFPGTFYGQSYAIAADGKENCFIAGTLYSGHLQTTVYDLVARWGKQGVACGFTSDGKPLLGWTADHFSVAWEIGADRKQNWYVAFFDFADGFVFKNGNPAVNLSGYGSDYPTKIVTGRDGSLYVTGHSWRRLGNPNPDPVYVGSTVLTNGGAFLAKFKFP